MGTRVKAERWTSSQSREEIHWFMPGGDVGYQHNTYLFGYNPQQVSATQIAAIKKILKVKVGK